jgi:hypothetical protein
VTRQIKRDSRFSSYGIERDQINDLRTLVELAQGKHGARTLARLTDRNLGGRGLMRHLGEQPRPDQSISDLDEFRAWLLGGLKKMFSKEGWKLFPRDDRFASFSVTIHARGDNEYEDQHGDGAPGMVAWKLIELHKWRIAQCGWDKCDLPGGFFVTHKKSAYCCPTHAQNARTKRYRVKLAREAKEK